jgi:F-type H+-transporting ATPase subunit b
MGLVTPGIGLIIWMTIAFLIVWVGLGKLAWPAIMKTIKEREESITNALRSAEEARKEMAKLQSDNERILKEAYAQRDAIMKEAKEIKDKIVAEAKDKAQAEADRIVASARESIATEKAAAMNEIKSHVAALSIDIAEKVLKSELSDATRQNKLVSDLLSDIKLN